MKFQWDHWRKLIWSQSLWAGVLFESTLHTCFWRAFLSIWLHSLKIALKIPFFILIQIKSIFHMRCGANCTTHMWTHVNSSLQTIIINSHNLVATFHISFSLPFFFHFVFYTFRFSCRLKSQWCSFPQYAPERENLCYFFSFGHTEKKIANVKTKESFFHIAVASDMRKIYAKVKHCFFCSSYLLLNNFFFSLQNCSLSFAAKWKSPMMEQKKKESKEKIDTKKNK